MNTKNEIMRFFSNQFESRERESGDTFFCMGDNRPTWCQDVARECHGDLLPDDWRYKWLSLASSILADIESDNWEERVFEIADDLTDVYNGRLLTWLSSNLTRAAYVEDYVNENGIDSNNFDLFRLLMAGQCQEISETLSTLIQQISDLAENVEPYTAGFNMCGCMPDSEPATFEDFQSAKDYILDELSEREEFELCQSERVYTQEATKEHETKGEKYGECWRWVMNQTDEFTVTVNGFAFWVTVSGDWLQNLGE